MDTGNSRIKVLTKDLEFIRHIENEGLDGRSCTGIDVSKDCIAIVNWRTKTVTSMNFNGDTISKVWYMKLKINNRVEVLIILFFLVFTQ